ncbi:MAG: class I SAM-dependent methyltransferase [Verrucomicrobiota bacterium]
MNWRIKGVVQKTLAAVPGGLALNDALQRTVGGLRNFEQNVATKVNCDWVVLAGHMRELGVPVAGQRYMEIGTGWYPTLPVCFQLAGATEVISYDLERHLNARLTERMWRALEAHLPAIAATGRPLAEVRAAYAQRVPFDYRAPADATTSKLPDNSIDVVFSNSVLEHVPRGVIRLMMQEAERVLRPGGLSIHSVNCADHYAYFDKSITFMNYYQFTEKDWQFWNNDLQYQNRMRPQDFIELSEQAGLKTVLAKHKPRPDLLAKLPALKLAPEFQQYPPEQLACTSVDFVGQKP